MKAAAKDSDVMAQVCPAPSVWIGAATAGGGRSFGNVCIPNPPSNDFSNLTSPNLLGCDIKAGPITFSVIAWIAAVRAANARPAPVSHQPKHLVQG